MKPHSHWVTLGGDLECRLSGVTPNKREIVHMAHGILVLKSKGHRYSYGNMPGDTSYAPTTIEIYRVVNGVPDSLGRLEIEGLTSYEVRKNKRDRYTTEGGKRDERLRTTD